jgi:hypothetical protein
MSITAAEPFLIVEVEAGAPSEPGRTGTGGRRFIPLLGGRVSGEIEGEIIPGGADWQTIHDDGNLQIEAHYAFRTASGAVVEGSVSSRIACGRRLMPTPSGRLRHRLEDHALQARCVQAERPGEAGDAGADDSDSHSCSGVSALRLGRYRM